MAVVLLAALSSDLQSLQGLGLQLWCCAAVTGCVCQQSLDLPCARQGLELLRQHMIGFMLCMAAAS